MTADADRPTFDVLASQLRLIRAVRGARDRDGRPVLTRAEIAGALGISLETYRRRLRDLRRLDAHPRRTAPF